MALFDTTHEYRALTGALADLPSPTTIRPEATLYFARDAGQLYWLSLAGGVASWLLVGGGGGSSGGLPKYFVNPAGQQPAAPYTSIQAAINAAVADGHNGTNPTAIVVYGGAFIENVTLADGIHILALADGVASGAALAGNVTATGLASEVSVEGLTIAGTVTQAGVNQALSLRRVAVLPPAGTDGVVTSADGGSRVNLFDATVTASGAGRALVANGAAVSARVSQFAADASTAVAVAAVAGTVSLTSTVVDGQTAIGATAHVKARDCRFLVGAATSPFNLADGSTLDVARSAYEGLDAGVDVFAGKGTVTHGLLSNAQGRFLAATTITHVANRTDLPYTKETFSGAGPFAASADLVYADPSGNAVVTLPDTRAYGPRRIVLKSSGAHQITWTAAAGDSIDGDPTVVIPADAFKRSVLVLQADPTNLIWDIVALY